MEILKKENPKDNNFRNVNILYNFWVSLDTKHKYPELLENGETVK